jgi:hypothetical protein
MDGDDEFRRLTVLFQGGSGSYAMGPKVSCLLFSFVHQQLSATPTAFDSLLLGDASQRTVHAPAAEGGSR